MIEEIARGTRKTRKAHQCFDCYRSIPAGMEAKFFTGKDDYIYTLYMHPDCSAAAEHYRADAYWAEYAYDGCPPLRDELQDSGEYLNELDRLRGHFPHVVARMELTDQLACAEAD